MSRLRLKPNHSTFKKVEKIFELMDELGIHIDPYSHGTSSTTIRDKDYPGITFDLQDIEEDNGFVIPIDFPPWTEYKITYEKP